MGKVIWHVPLVGYWLLDAKKPIIVLPIVYTLGLVTMIEEVKQVADYYKAQTPYRLEGYRLQTLPKRSFAKLYAGADLFLGIVIALSFLGPKLVAAMQNNTITLAPNTISAVGTTKTPPTCGENSTSNVNVHNTTSQTATGGNTSNSNSTGINIGITQC